MMDGRRRRLLRVVRCHCNASASAIKSPLATSTTPTRTERLLDNPKKYSPLHRSHAPRPAPGARALPRHAMWYTPAKFFSNVYKEFLWQ